MESPLTKLLNHFEVSTMEKQIIISNSELNNFHEMKEAYAKLLAKDSHGLKKIYHKNPEALFNQITASRDTIFHVAAYKGDEEMLELLVKLVPNTKKREVLKMKNIYGNSILHEVVTTGNIKAADLIMQELLFRDGPLNHETDTREREDILADRNKLGETPLFRAAEHGNKMMVMYLAREIERVGNIHQHYTRNDGVSILHIAVIGQHFETAIWLVEKDPKLATYKDDNGKTSLHLLASMTTAFKSTSFQSLHGFQKFVYHYVPSEPCDAKDQLPIVMQNKDLEQGEPSKCSNKTGSSKGLKLYCRFWTSLARGWQMIDRVWDQKLMHLSAVKLAKLLVQTDASWFESHEPEEDDTICLQRKEDEGQANADAGKGHTSEPDTPLFIAASTGISEIVKEILKQYPQAIEHINSKGQNILHVVTLYRTYEVFTLLKRKEEVKRLVRGIDNRGCTILHHAAETKYYRGGTKATPALKLQEELEWFQAVKDQIPSFFTLHCSKENKTADKLFKQKHEDQLKTAQEWVKNTAQSCSTVAVLVATVVFAAAYTAPGGFYSDQNGPDSSEIGKPVLLNKPLYSFFTVMDVAGLASSLTSLVIFLSILTSSLEFGDFVSKIPRNLSLGFTFLFFSVTSTMLTFTATIFLLLDLKKTLTKQLTYAAATLPIFIFALFIFPVYYEYFIAAVKSIFNFIRMNMPGNWEFLRIDDDFD